MDDALLLLSDVVDGTVNEADYNEWHRLSWLDFEREHGLSFDDVEAILFERTRYEWSLSF